MALTTEQEQQLLTDVDILFKEVFAGKASSNRDRQFFEEPFNLDKLVFPSQIAADEELIPDTAAEVPGVIELVQDLALLPVPGSPDAYYHPDIAGAVKFNFGDGSSYIQEFKKADDSAIAFGQNGMVFSDAAGVLYFRQGNPDGVSHANPPKVSQLYKYVGTKGIVASGGDSETFDSVLQIASDPDAIDPPNYGDRYLIGNAAVGIWEGREGQIAEKKNINFSYTEPTDGATVKVDDQDGKIFHHEGLYIPGTFSWVQYTVSSIRMTNLVGSGSYSGTTSPPLADYDSSVLIAAIPATSSPGPSTISLDGLPATQITVTSIEGTQVPLEQNDFVAGEITFFWYDGTNMRLVGTQRRTVTPMTIFVDGVRGNDTSGKIEDAARPFQTLQAAYDAIPNDEDYWIIKPAPGIYEQRLDLGTDRTFDFAILDCPEGFRMEYRGSDDGPLIYRSTFHGSNYPCLNIRGKGEFYRGGSGASGHCIGSGSDPYLVNIEGAKLIESILGVALYHPRSIVQNVELINSTANDTIRTHPNSRVTISHCTVTNSAGHGVTGSRITVKDSTIESTSGNALRLSEAKVYRSELRTSSQGVVYSTLQLSEFHDSLLESTWDNATSYGVRCVTYYPNTLYIKNTTIRLVQGFALRGFNGVGYQTYLGSYFSHAPEIAANQVVRFTVTSASAGEVFDIPANGPFTNTQSGAEIITYTATSNSISEVTAGLKAAWDIAALDPESNFFGFTVVDTGTYIEATAANPGIGLNQVGTAGSGSNPANPNLSYTVTQSRAGFYNQADPDNDAHTVLINEFV